MADHVRTALRYILSYIEAHLQHTSHACSHSCQAKSEGWIELSVPRIRFGSIGGEGLLFLAFKTSGHIDDEVHRGRGWPTDPVVWTGRPKGGVLLEREMGADAIAVVGVGSEDLAKMRFGEDHDIIQALSPERAEESVDVSVLPG
jgi:hypothetical protein